MLPKMRSIFAQVYQKSVSMGRSRNFSSSPTNFKESKKETLAIFFVTRTVGIASGFLTGHFLIGDVSKYLDEKLQKDLIKAEEKLRKRDKLLAFVTKDYK
ncbi:hypothetical protein HA466_0192390 [Hirschfeldia incana]|nr:hypothetical protein HA466_0192390 [Hirschfeldia incana]